MSPLEDALQEQKQLVNKGYSVEEIQCAATMLIAKLLMPTITHGAKPLTPAPATPPESERAND